MNVLSRELIFPKPLAGFINLNVREGIKPVLPAVTAAWQINSEKNIHTFFLFINIKFSFFFSNMFIDLYSG